MHYWRVYDVCGKFAGCLSISVLQMEILKFSFSEKSCACIKKLLVSFGTVFLFV